MAIKKAHLELRLLRLDQFLKPLSLATPILLAIGIYFLVQAPAIESSDATRCLEEVRFVQQLEGLEDGTDIVAYITAAEGLLTCPNVRSLAQSRADTILASQAISAASDEISSLVPDAVSTQSGTTPNVCEVAIFEASTEQNVQFRVELQNLADELGRLVVQRDALIAEAEAELFGLDGRPPGQGPRFFDLQQRIGRLESQINALQAQIDQQRLLIDRRNGEFMTALQSCRTNSSGG